MQLGFTGTQEGLTAVQALALKGVLCREFTMDLDEFHHGDCVGADAQAHDLCRELGFGVKIIIHPPTDEKKRAHKAGDLILPPFPYLTRNQHIVNSVELMIGCPRQFKPTARSGTWYTLRYAKRHKTVIVIVWPDGQVETTLDLKVFRAS